MRIETLLKKHFDIVIHTDYDENFEEPTRTRKAVYQIWIYESGEDCEPLLILKDARDLLGQAEEGWVVGNVYSALKHDAVYTTSEFKTLIKSGGIKSQFA